MVNLDFNIPVWTTRKKKNGLPDSEHHSTLSEREMDDLIARYRRQRQKEMIWPSGKEYKITKDKIKRALPDAYRTAQAFSKDMHTLNPDHRKSLARATREALKGE